MKKDNSKLVQIDWINKFAFPGSQILYPIISAFCLFFYLAFFGSGIYVETLEGYNPNWMSWWLFAIVAFALFFIWLYFKGWCSRIFVSISLIIAFLTFCSLQYVLSYKADNLVGLIIACFYIIIFCSIKFLKRPISIRKSWPWLLPLVMMMSYYFFRLSMQCIFWSGVVSMILITCSQINCRLSYGRWFMRLGVILIYVAVVLVYCPHSPFIHTNIEAIWVNPYPRSVSLITKTGDNYNVVDGWTNREIIPIKFNYCKRESIVKNKIVGFSRKKNDTIDFYRKFINKSGVSLYPIFINDSSVGFSPVVYNFLKNSVNTDCPILSLSSKLFFDYLNLFENPSSQHIADILDTYTSLQKHFNKLATDSTVLKSTDIDDVKLCRLAKFSSLGALNALSSDLLYNKDYWGAISIYAYQFLFTFYDSPIYRNVNTTMYFNLNKNYNGSEQHESFCVPVENLKNIGNFDDWVKINRASLFMAEQCVLSNTINSDIMHKMRLVGRNFDDPKAIKEMDNDLALINEVLFQYRKTKYLREFATKMNKFYYSCILNNSMPEFESFFLNRFKEISMCIPLDSTVMADYKGIQEYYTAEFDKSIKTFEDIQLNAVLFKLALELSKKNYDLN